MTTHTGEEAGFRFDLAPDPEEPWGDDELPGYYVTAECDGVGVGSAQFVHSRDGQRVVLTGDIWVDEAYRRRGVASGLMRHLRAETGKWVDPNGFTGDGLALWESLGWSADAPRKRSEKEES